MSGIADFSSYAKRVSRANRQVHGTPTESQREAGNFKTGKLHLHGLDLRIEYAKGGVRTGTSPDGTKWKRVMTCPYGRIKRTVGLDGEAVDFFLGAHPESQLVFVISQLDSDGNLDEHKCVLGTRNVTEAKKTYLSNYPDGWGDERMGEVRGYFVKQFRDWLKTDAPRKNRTKKADTPPSVGEGKPLHIERNENSGVQISYKLHIPGYGGGKAGLLYPNSPKESPTLGTSKALMGADRVLYPDGVWPRSAAVGMSEPKFGTTGVYADAASADRAQTNAAAAAQGKPAPQAGTPMGGDIGLSETVTPTLPPEAKPTGASDLSKYAPYALGGAGILGAVALMRHMRRKRDTNKTASIPHDDGEVCSTCHAREIEEHTGACRNCGAIRSMVESRLKRTEQGLPSAVRAKEADCDEDDHPGQCPKCRDRGDPEWKNDVLARCRRCDHVWFAHEKRAGSSIVRLLSAHKAATE